MKQLRTVSLFHKIVTVNWNRKVQRTCAAAFLLSISACASVTPITVSNGTDPSDLNKIEINKQKKIIILEPKITYERVSNRMPVFLKTYTRNEISRLLTEGAKQSFNKAGYRTLVPGYFGEDGNQLQTAYVGLTKATHLLLRSSPGAQVNAFLENICSENRNQAILAQYLQVKLGTGGTWDPNSGALTPATSTSYLRAVLIDCQSKKSLWRNAVFFRGVPKVKDTSSSDSESKYLMKAISTLYHVNSTKGEQ